MRMEESAVAGKPLRYVIDRRFVLHVIPIAERDAVCGQNLGYRVTTAERPPSTAFTIACFTCERITKAALRTTTMPATLDPP